MPTPTFPVSPRPTRVRWRKVHNSATFTSPFTGATRTQERPGARWGAVLEFANWRRDELADLEAFLWSLRGSAGRFYLWHHAREEVRGSAAGSPVVVHAENMLPYSEALDISPWQTGTTTVSPNAVTAPDGQVTADRVIPTTTNDRHSINQLGVDYAIGSTYTLSIFGKAGEYAGVVFGSTNAVTPSGYRAVIADLSVGQLVNVVGSPPGFGIVPVGDGWYRIWVSFVAEDTVTTAFKLQVMDAVNGSTEPDEMWVGDGSSGLYLWGALLQRSAVIGPYVASGADPVVGAHALGANLTTGGWTPNAAGVLLPGDLVGAGGELKAVIGAVDADAFGIATVPIEPPLRAAPPQGSTVVLIKPTVLMKLKTDVDEIDYQKSLGSLVIECEEAF